MVKNTKETFINECGETWTFEYIKEHNIGIATSNDFLIEGLKIPIVNGINPLLVLNKEEKVWLKNMWDKHSIKEDYSCETTDITTFLTNQKCPICSKVKDEFENHHAVAASEGGSDDVVNILSICKTCHSVITNGCLNESVSGEVAAVYFLQMVHGIDHFYMNPKNNKRYPDREDYLYDIRPEFLKIKETYEKANDKRKQSMRNYLKQSSEFRYIFHRAMFNGYKFDEKYLKWAKLDELI